MTNKIHHQYPMFSGDPIYADPAIYDSDCLEDLGDLLNKKRGGLLIGFCSTQHDSIRGEFDDFAREFIADYLAWIKSRTLPKNWHLCGNSNKHYKHANAGLNTLARHNKRVGRDKKLLHDRVDSFMRDLRYKYDYTAPPPAPIIAKLKRGRITKKMAAMGWVAGDTGSVALDYNGGRDSMLLSSQINKFGEPCFVFYRKENNKPKFTTFANWADAVLHCEAVVI